MFEFVFVLAYLCFPTVQPHEWEAAWSLKPHWKPSVEKKDSLQIYESPKHLTRKLKKMVFESNYVEDECSNADLFKVPRRIWSSTPADYPFLESSLQIFKSIEMPCDGDIKSFHFISAKEEVNQFESCSHLKNY